MAFRWSLGAFLESADLLGLLEAEEESEGMVDTLKELLPGSNALTLVDGEEPGSIPLRGKGHLKGLTSVTFPPVSTDILSLRRLDVGRG